MRRIFPIAAALAAILGVTGCAATQVTAAWTNPGATTVPLKRVLVVALVPDAATRYQLESQLAAKLASDGIQGVPSWQLVPEGTRLTREALQQAMAGRGFDGMLISRFLGLHEQVAYVPGDTWGGYVGYWGPGVYQPGYYEVTRMARMQSTLFDAREGGKTLWTITTQTNATDTTPQQEIPGFVAVVVEQLKKDLRPT